MTRGDLFKFTNTRGQAVKGIVFGAGSGETGVVYLPGIVLGMTAVHRMGLGLAASLATAGYPTYLFDPAGVGESEGDFPAGTHPEVSAWVEAGHLVDDTLEALDAFVARAGLARVVLIGHCGGALTASYAAARHPAVAGALLICPPSLASAAAPDALDRESVAATYRQQYLAKLSSPEAWLRLVRGHSSYRTIARLALGKLRRTLEPWIGRLRPAAGAPPEAPRRVFNDRLRAALDTAHARGVALAAVFGDRDPELEAFRDLLRVIAAELPLRVFPDTSHGFVTEASMALLTAEVHRFVDEGLPAAQPTLRRAITAGACAARS